MASSTRLQLGAAVASLALVSLLVMRVSSAAFSATTENVGNSWDTGSITLKDEYTGGVATALFDISGMLPGQTETRCITVTYEGVVNPTPVKLYTSVTDGGLADYLNIQVREATETGGTGSTCGTLSATTVIVTTRTLNAFGTAHSAYGNGAGSWDPAADGESKTYEFVVTLPSNAPTAAQGTDAQATFTWETTT